MKKLVFIAVAASMLCLSGCLSRTYYYQPSTAETQVKGTDGNIRGPIQAEGYFPWWSDAQGKSFLNPNFSFIGK